MPRQLPGLCWDDDRQRYFPLAHRQHDVERERESTPSLVRRARPLSDLRSVLRTAHKDALLHQIRSSQFALTCTCARSTVLYSGLVSAFQSVSYNGLIRYFAGSNLGWFYSSVEGEVAWQPQFYLSSEISSVCVSGTTCIATSFGPECRILYAPLDLSVEVIHKIDSRILHDIWTADLHGSRLVLGANKQAVMIKDIAVTASLQRLPTHSDVFALAQRDNMVYTGLRNGGILRFDTRLQRSNSHSLFSSASQCASSVTSLKHLRDHQLVVSYIDGGISMFDLRFPTWTPLMTFTGNFNKYIVKLPLATDPYEKFMFAAGQDNRIRLWSLITGGPTLDSAGACPTNQNIFQQPFQQRVAALQVVEDREGMSLLAASGTELCKYSLGHRSGICI